MVCVNTKNSVYKQKWANNRPFFSISYSHLPTFMTLKVPKEIEMKIDIVDNLLKNCG